MAAAHYGGNYHSDGGSLLVGNTFHVSGQSNINFNKSRGLVDLPVARGAAFDDYEDQDEPRCLEGTRTDLLKDIMEWARAEAPAEKWLLWLRGMAGTGKSTVSRTIAKSLLDDKFFVVSFFFKRGEPDRSNGSRFFTTIASQLAVHFTSVKSAILAAVEADPGITGRALGMQFEKLVLHPLSELETVSNRILVLIIDALDECKTTDARAIINLFAKLKSIVGIKIRIFLTSRPEGEIQDIFEGFPEIQNIVLHEVPAIEHDIALFLRYSLSQIARKKSYRLPTDWPGDDVLQTLVSRAIPLFIYAATLCRFIQHGCRHPKNQLRILLDYQPGLQGVHMELNETYFPILEQLIIGRSEVDKLSIVAEFKKVVGTIINLASPLSISSLAGLLFLDPKDIEWSLRNLHSVLNVPKNYDSPIRIFHLSFSEFLMDKRNQSSIFWIEQKEAHRGIARRCMNIMSTSLKKDICGLKAPGTLRSQISEEIMRNSLPFELQYACRYWVYHLQQGYDAMTTYYCNQVYTFLQKHILHWLEAISLLGDIHKVVYMIDSLNSIIKMDNHIVLHEFLCDMRRTVLQMQFGIDKAPLQIYVSAIMFAPETSRVRALHNPEKEISWISGFPSVQKEWDALLQTVVPKRKMMSRGSTLNCLGLALVKFSHDGKCLSTSGNTVSIWDTISGSLLQTLSCPLSIIGMSICRNSRIVAASTRKGIVLWDVGTGVCLGTLDFESPEMESQCLEFLKLPSGPSLIALSSTGVQIWDIANRAMLGYISLDDMCMGHIWQFEDILSTSVKAVLEELNINIDSTSTAERVFWARLLNRRVLPLNFDIFISNLGFRGSVDKPVRLAFSWDHRFLATANKYGKIWVRELYAIDYEQSERFMYSRDGTSAMCFSPDGKILVSSLGSETIQLLDIATGNRLRRVESGHGFTIEDIAFSSDGKTIATVGTDGTVKWWDIAKLLDASNTPTRDTNVNSRGINTASFSVGGKVVISRSNGDSLGLWESATGRLITRLALTTDFIDILIAYSPDDKIFAANMNKCEVCLRCTSTGNLVRTLKMNPTIVFGVMFRAMQFSSTGELLGVVREETQLEHLERPNRGEVTIWNVATGRLVWTRIYPLFQNEKAEDLEFSSDNKLLAVALSPSISPTGIEIMEIDIVTKPYVPAEWEYMRARPPTSNYLVRSRMQFSTDNAMLVVVRLDQHTEKNTLEIYDTGTRCLVGYISIDYIPRYVSFSNDHQSINTHRHNYILKKGSGRQNPMVIYTEKYKHDCIEIEDGWLCRGNEKLVWLPHSYRPTPYDPRLKRQGQAFDVYGKLVVIGHPNGQLSWIELADTKVFQV